MTYDGFSGNRHSARVPKYSRESIEERAERLLDWFDSAICSTPQRTPLEGIAHRLGSQFGVRFCFDKDLGTCPATGKRILGQYEPNPPAILIDRTVQNTKRWSFTLAHEIGHLILHQNAHLWRDVDAPADSIVDDSRHMFFGRKNLRTHRDWIEWHANKFAGALLLPRRMVVRSVVEKQTELGITNNIGTVFVDHQTWNIWDAKQIVSHVVATFQTSRSVANIRLRNLGILQDHREVNSTHTAVLLRSA